MIAANLPIAIGSRFEMAGRQRTVWKVESVIEVPRAGRMVRLAQEGGLGKITLRAEELFGRHGLTAPVG